MNCNEANAHPRDGNLVFDEKAHAYYLGERELPSVTQVVEGLFPKFDAVYWANRKARYLGLNPERLLEQWEERGKEARELGTRMHAAIERYYLGEDDGEDGDALTLFREFASRRTLYPFRTEWRVYDEEMGLAGTLDFLERLPDGQYFLWDWKRSAKLVKNGQLVYTHPYGNTGLGVCQQVPDVPYWHYTLQLGIYARILAKSYDINVSEMRLGVFHPTYNRAYVIKIPRVDNLITKIFQELTN